jgi:transposase
MGMPERPMTRAQDWLLPPTLGELLSEDHPARFVAAFVDALTEADWRALGVIPGGAWRGSPRYHPRLLLGVWLYGFLTGVRSSRKLEAACEEQVALLWLTGRQHPDHNTLWRFYQAHRAGLRSLFRRTVRIAVHLGLVDLALQAVDGTKLAANAAKDRTYDERGLTKLLARVETTIAELEAQNATGGDPPPPRLPVALQSAQTLREQVEAALETVRAEEGPPRVNLTDAEASLMKGRSGYLVGYNAQAMVSPLAEAVAGRSGLFLTAVEVTTTPADQGQLTPMIAQAAAHTEQAAGLTLADGGYHSGENLARCAQAGYPIAMPESYRAPTEAPAPYGQSAFTYDEASDTYTCPAGQRLPFTGLKRARGEVVGRTYRAAVPATCRACPAFGTCTRNSRQGRILTVSRFEAELRAHRQWMATPEAKAAYRRRKQIVEPVFGILKERQGARRLLLRGRAAVRAEWTLLATACNLHTLWRIWRGAADRSPTTRLRLVGAAA